MNLVRRVLGVRARSALAAVLVVAVVLAVAATGFLVLHRRAVVQILDTAAAERAAALADRVAAQDRAGIDRLLVTPPGESTVIQVIGGKGTVVADSANIHGAPVISTLRPPSGLTRRQDRQLQGLGEDPFRIIVVGVKTASGPSYVLVARSLAPANESTETEVALVLVGYPLLLLAVGAATVLFVGRSLRAVEAVRLRVAGITARHLHERVPVPAARDEVYRLVEDLLLLARVDERGLVPRYTDVDLDDLVLAQRHRLAGRADLKVAVRIEPVRLRADRRQLERALTNLVDNAAAHARVAVDLRVRQDAGHAYVEIGNDGPAIPVHERERVFERFVRLDESRARRLWPGTVHRS